MNMSTLTQVSTFYISRKLWCLFYYPRVGASRYQSSSSSVPAATSGSYQDPFTGAGGYHGGGPPTTHTPGGSYVDPFTGASGYHGASSTPAPTNPPPRAVPSPAAVGILPVVSSPPTPILRLMINSAHLDYSPPVQTSQYPCNEFKVERDQCSSRRRSRKLRISFALSVLRIITFSSS